ASRLARTSAPASCSPGCRLTTRLSRPGSGRPRESQVLRPMMIGLFKVNALTCLRSAGRCQGMLLFNPITRSWAQAAMRHRGRWLFIGAEYLPAFRAAILACPEYNDGASLPYTSLETRHE